MTDIQDRPVVYMPASEFIKARDGKAAPIAILRKQSGWSNQVKSSNSLVFNSERLRCVVLSLLHDCPIEAVSVNAHHSYQTGQPVVPDDHGVPQRSPSARKNLSGATSVDWIDSPPHNFAAVGVWATNRPAFSFFGTDIGLTAVMPARESRLQISLINSISNSGCKLLASLTSTDDQATSDDDFYDKCDEKDYGPAPVAPNSITLSNKNVKVSLRMGPASRGIDVYAFVEPA